MIGRLQLDLPLPAIPEPPHDFEGSAREELTTALGRARAAIDAPPWDYRTQRYWRVVGPQMSGWLPDDEQAAFLTEFMPELDRIEPMFGGRP
ncbi:MAG TPA: hypothetical protein VNH53_03980 [Sphingomicrobium sp.]|jgi:hypothetical protein|nr:hypothetical protein [Sphingomicrobium sp.]